MTADSRNNTKAESQKIVHYNVELIDKGGMSSDEREKGSHEGGVLSSY